MDELKRILFEAAKLEDLRLQKILNTEDLSAVAVKEIIKSHTALRTLFSVMAQAGCLEEYEEWRHG